MRTGRLLTVPGGCLLLVWGECLPLVRGVCLLLVGGYDFGLGGVCVGGSVFDPLCVSVFGPGGVVVKGLDCTCISLMFSKYYFKVNPRQTDHLLPLRILLLHPIQYAVV